MSDFASRYTTALWLLAAALVATAGTDAVQAQNATLQATAGKKRGPPKQSKAEHKVAVQVNDNDPRVMNLALNNASNVVEYYRSKGEKVTVEIVTYGPGLHMLRADTSPVKARIAQMSIELPQLSFAACANTQSNMAKQEGKDIPIIAEARVVPSGVVRLMELQEGGYTYIRP